MLFTQISPHCRMCSRGKALVFARMMTTQVLNQVSKQTGKSRSLQCLKRTPNVYEVRNMTYMSDNIKRLFMKHGVDPSKAVLIYRNGNYKSLTVLPVMMQMSCFVFFPLFCWKYWEDLTLDFSQFSIGHPAVHTILATLASLNAFIVITIVHRRLGSLQYIYKYKDSNAYLAIVRNYSNFGTKQMKFTQQECVPYVGGTRVGNIKIKNRVYHVSSGHFTTLEYLNEIMGFPSNPEPVQKYTKKRRKKINS